MAQIERPQGVTLHPSRTIDVDAAPPAVFAKCIDAVERVLGGAIRESDAARGTIEATFGLVNSERLSISIDALEEDRSRVLIQSRRGASAEPRKRSEYVDALAEFLQT